MNAGKMVKILTPQVGWTELKEDLSNKRAGKILPQWPIKPSKPCPRVSPNPPEQPQHNGQVQRIPHHAIDKGGLVGTR